MFYKFGELEKEGISPTMASFSARLMVFTDNGIIWNGISYLSGIFIPMKLRWRRGRRGYSAAGPQIFICLPLADARFGPWETPVLIGKPFWWSQNHRKSGKFPHLQATDGCWYPKLLAPNLEFLKTGFLSIANQQKRPYVASCGFACVRLTESNAKNKHCSDACF